MSEIFYIPSFPYYVPPFLGEILRGTFFRKNGIPLNIAYALQVPPSPFLKQILLEFLLEVRTLTQKEIDERSAHLVNLYQLLGRLDVVHATMVAA